MGGSTVPMAVGGVDIKADEFCDVGQIIGQSGFQAGIEQANSLLANSKSALAAQGGEEMIEVRCVWQVSSYFLKKASSASHFMKHPQYSEREPVCVRQLQADSRRLQAWNDLCKRGEKALRHRTVTSVKNWRRVTGEEEASGISEEEVMRIFAHSTLQMSILFRSNGLISCAPAMPIIFRPLRIEPQQRRPRGEARHPRLVY